MITISLNEIRKHNPCVHGWNKLLKYLKKKKADDEQFPFRTIIDSNGLDYAVWALRCLADQTPARLFAVAVAQDVLDLIDDQRSRDAVRIAHLFAHDEATATELSTAWDAGDATWATTWDAASAWSAASAAASATDVAGDAAWYAGDAARAAAWAAARDAAWDAGYAAWDAGYAAWDASGEKQKQHLIAIVENYKSSKVGTL